MPDKNGNNINKERKFTQRLDFYWQYLALYSVILLVYSVIKGSVEEGTLTLVIYDPIVILLAVLIVGSAVPMLFNYYKNGTIFIGFDYISFKSRFGTKSFSLEDIHSISFGRERLIKVKKGVYRVIKIKVKTRKMAIKIRPGSFTGERKLVKAIATLKKKLDTKNRP